MKNLSETMARTHTRTSEAPRKRRGSRTTAAVISGCLVLSLCPAIALAAPSDQAGSPQGPEPTMMQQAPGAQAPDAGAPQADAPEGEAPAWQAPQNGTVASDAPQGGAPDTQDAGEWTPREPIAGQPTSGGTASAGRTPIDQMQGSRMQDEQAPDSQHPQGGMTGELPQDNRNDMLNGKIREILSSDFGINIPLERIEANDITKPIDAGKSAVELPEGEINVQQVIDSIRDLLSTYSIDELESADFTDADFTAELSGYLAKANEARFAEVAGEQKPDQATQSQQAKTVLNTAESSSAVPSDDEFARETTQFGADKPRDQEPDDTMLSQLVNFIVSLFGQQA